MQNINFSEIRMSHHRIEIVETMTGCLQSIACISSDTLEAAIDGLAECTNQQVTAEMRCMLGNLVP